MLDRVARIAITLSGSLGATGKGHGSDKAILLGLLGEEPDTVDVDAIAALVQRVRDTGRLRVLGTREIPFAERGDLAFNHRDTLPMHSNGMRFVSTDENGGVLADATYYSVGGGFVVADDPQSAGKRIVPDLTPASAMRPAKNTSLAGTRC